ncbi:glycosyltransferase [Terrimicrobium sacchariphilum]|uniref:Glycosyltransferase n=1 Tax=Terrimicrobium sacchariphilum TaxID=690879 RepID=A0A146G2N7_TERSA|nr:glycosyltransferase family 4 protein [Terrimicrobium sacchariphilum]GAT31752.1 glycosyltransferase [Terrimicrobium sacchariphilum]
MARRLKILQIFNRYMQYGGEEGSVYRIGDAMQSIHDVEYFLTSTESWIARRGGNRIAMLADTFANLEIVRRLRRYQKIGRFNVWQIHNVIPTMSPLVYREAFRANIPVVHYLHNYRLFCANGFFLNHGEPCMRCAGGNFLPAVQTACWRNSRLNSGLMSAVILEMRAFGLFEKTAAWISISQRQKDIHASWGIPREKIEVIPHFYEAGESPLPPGSSESILFLGRLSSEKGVAQLIEAWSLLKTRGKQRLIIAGDGPERAALERLAQKLDAKNVEFRGFIDRNEQTALWRESRASVVPSIWEEPFGMVVLEAWSKGRAVIANRIGALPEIIDHGVNGLLAQPFSPEALASQMDEMLRNPDRASQMGLEGYNKLKSRYNREEWVLKLRNLYHKVGNELPL